jgi:hypothetical protein
MCDGRAWMLSQVWGVDITVMVCHSFAGFDRGLMLASRPSCCWNYFLQKHAIQYTGSVICSLHEAAQECGLGAAWGSWATCLHACKSALYHNWRQQAVSHQDVSPNPQLGERLLIKVGCVPVTCCSSVHAMNGETAQPPVLDRDWFVSRCCTLHVHHSSDNRSHAQLRAGLVSLCISCMIAFVL